MNSRLVFFLCVMAGSAGCKRTNPAADGQEKADGKVDAGEDEELRVAAGAGGGWRLVERAGGDDHRPGPA